MLDKHHFVFEGRRRTLFKISRTWYFYREINGKRLKRSLHTSAVKAAEEKAKNYYRANTLEQFEKIDAIFRGADKIKKTFCSTENYLALYESKPSGDNERSTRHNNVLALRRLAGDELPTTMDPLAIEKMCKAAKTRAAARIEAEPDGGKKKSMRTTFDSMMRNATSIFSQTAVYNLRDELTLPTFEEFDELRSNLKNLYFGDAKKTVKEFHPPSDEILEKTVAGWLKLSKHEFLAVGLALCAGLRRKEIFEMADWSWFVVKNQHVWLDGYADPKDRTGLIYVSVLDPFYSLMMARVRAEGWETTGRIVDSWRAHLNISAWMKELGWKTKKHLHALRAWAGSLVYDAYGAEESRRFCRHDTIETTDDSYGYMRKKFHLEGMAVTVNERKVEWANKIKGVFTCLPNASAASSSVLPMPTTPN